MDKKEYIVNQLKKTYGKKYENYCITRIITKLDNINLQFVTQKMFRRSDGKIALADLYFPQVNVWVEIDESQHINNLELDEIRTYEVVENNIQRKLRNLEEIIYIGVNEPERIKVFDKDFNISIEDINKRIDEIVLLINNKIKKLGKDFIPWTGVEKLPEYFINKGNIDIYDDVKFKTIQDVSELFNKGYRGMQLAYFKVNENTFVWCPKLRLNDTDFKKSRYINEISDDGKYIYESSLVDNDRFVNDVINSNEVRYIFPKYMDECGQFMYRYAGIYKLDKKSMKRLGLKKRVWVRDYNNNIDISKYFK